MTSTRRAIAWTVALAASFALVAPTLSDVALVYAVAVLAYAVGAVWLRWDAERTLQQIDYESRVRATRSQNPTEWEEDCLEYRGVLLTGRYAHYCLDWDGLPIDETCVEWPCCAFEPVGITDAQKADALRINRAAQESFRARAMALGAER